MNEEKLEKLKTYFAADETRISALVPFEKGANRVLEMDFTAANSLLTPTILSDTEQFSEWINSRLIEEQCRYGLGGYGEHRTIYSRSNHFDSGEEPRRLHLGIDIWGPAKTAVFAPVEGKIHSFKFNDHFGDYGATLILLHELEDVCFYTLYGHLTLASIADIEVGQIIPKGEHIADFGEPAENGHWPPHLHFQLIFDLEGMEGDYPGVCQFSLKEYYLDNCPDPSILLKQTFGY